ncbi:hypothetical protein NERG_02174 [Nematocida ausubeli]|uniref:Uncharacterized protein n=1 Tax=Nematocida ausubeli (strain ATCC PRA-371 / ERTm2) TaxID=1913371 RepID=H8ZF05_NEMA1|nr:hypothetical protein NERG_02174 [Nematocida ausubeli]
MNCGFILVLLHIYYIQAMHEINDPNGFSSLESLHTFRTQDNSPGVFSRIYTKFTDLFKTTKRELGYENEDANVVHYNKDADDEWSQLICDAERNTNETNPATGDPSKKKEL